MTIDIISKLTSAFKGVQERAAAKRAKCKEIEFLGETIAQAILTTNFDLAISAIQTISQKDWSPDEKENALTSHIFKIDNSKTQAFPTLIDGTHVKFTQDQRKELIKELIKAGVDPFAFNQYHQRRSGIGGMGGGVSIYTVRIDSMLHCLARGYGQTNVQGSLFDQDFEPLELVLEALVSRDGAEASSEKLRSYTAFGNNMLDPILYAVSAPNKTIHDLIPNTHRAKFDAFITKLGISFEKAERHPLEDRPLQVA